MSLVKFNRKNSLVPSFNSWIDNFFRDDDRFFDNWKADWQVPPVNVEETEKEYQLSLAAPGLQKKDFNIEVKDNTMIISSETSDESEESDENYTRKEFSYNSFQRSFWLPENVNADKINANYEDGLLKISVPKIKETKAKIGKKIKVA